MAVRSALGASRARLVTQMIAEGALIALAGGLLGVLLAPAGMKVLAALVPTALPASAAPAVDARVLGFALLLSVLTGVGFSIVPAWQASRVTMNDALKQGGRGGIGGAAAGTRDALVILEVAAALVLMVGAGLMLQTVARLRAIDIGFRPEPSAHLAHHPAAHQVSGPGETNRLLSSRASGSARAARRGERGIHIQSARSAARATRRATASKAANACPAMRGTHCCA